MKITRVPLPRRSLEQFADEHGLVMKVHERTARDCPGRFYAYFEHAEIKDGHMLVGAFGNGRTEDEAIQSYAKEISGRALVLNSYTVERKEIVVPILELGNSAV